MTLQHDAFPVALPSALNISPCINGSAGDCRGPMQVRQHYLWHWCVIRKPVPLSALSDCY